MDRGSCEKNYTTGCQNTTNTTNQSLPIYDTSSANETTCTTACPPPLVNNSGNCSSSCPSYTYAQDMYSNCNPCESVAYDNGTVWSKNLSKCINASACKYTSLLVTNFTLCEDASDPPPSATCPYY